MLIEPEGAAHMPTHTDERHVLEPPSAESVIGVVVETVRASDRALEAERAAFSRRCAMCGAPFQGRQDKRFCRDACRTRFGRERMAKEVQATIALLARLAGVER